MTHRIKIHIHCSLLGDGKKYMQTQKGYLKIHLFLSTNVYLKTLSAEHFFFFPFFMGMSKYLHTACSYTFSSLLHIFKYIQSWLAFQCTWFYIHSLSTLFHKWISRFMHSQLKMSLLCKRDLFICLILFLHHGIGITAEHMMSYSHPLVRC